jgi:hypothetical protein
MPAHITGNDSAWLESLGPDLVTARDFTSSLVGGSSPQVDRDDDPIDRDDDRSGRRYRRRK